MPSARAVIVGGGQAGAQAAFALRGAGFEGSITLVCAEQLPPYQRPPLSKDYLAGKAAFDKLLVRATDSYADRGIAVRLGERVHELDLDTRTVRLATESVAYDQLILATGSSVRGLSVPGTALSGVYSLRTASDSDTIRAELGPGKRLVVIGGGYIGLEVAATAISMGAHITILEIADRCLSRVTGSEIAGFLEERHKQAGVEIVCGTTVSRFEGAQAVEGVVCSDGRSWDADVVVVGVGIVPADTLAQEAGIACMDGIVVDHRLRTDAPDVYAIGDVANAPNDLVGQRLRLESVSNAAWQAKAVARSVMGEDLPAAEAPWFWSDQYDHRLQMVGIPADSDEAFVRRGDNTIAVFYVRERRLVAAHIINDPRAFMTARKAVTARMEVDVGALQDPRIALKEAVRTP